MVDVYNEEYWKSVPNFPGYRVSSLGNVINVDGIDIPRTVNRKREPCVKLEYYTDSFSGPVWLLMLRSMYRTDFTRVDVDYRDGNSNNLNMFNLLFREKSDGTPIQFRLQPDGIWIRLRKNARPIRIVETNMVFDSVRECADYIGGNSNLIYCQLRGVAKTHLGYTFEYI